MSKRRTRLAGILIPLGNRYLRAQGAWSEVLSCKDWIAWEHTLAVLLKREIRTTSDRRGLEFPAIAGFPLEQLLQANRPLSEKLEGISLAAEALRRLHVMFVSTPELDCWLLSHGDATCRNVIVNLESSSADWIDFDIRHRPQISNGNRHADDLRVLIWSCAALLEVAHYGGCVGAAFEGYSDREVISDCRQLCLNSKQPTVFQLGQASITGTNFAHLRQTIAGH